MHGVCRTGRAEQGSGPSTTVAMGSDTTGVSDKREHDGGAPDRQRSFGSVKNTGGRPLEWLLRGIKYKTVRSRQFAFKWDAGWPSWQQQPLSYPKH